MFLEFYKSGLKCGERQDKLRINVTTPLRMESYTNRCNDASKFCFNHLFWQLEATTQLQFCFCFCVEYNAVICSFLLLFYQYIVLLDLLIYLLIYYHGQGTDYGSHNLSRLAVTSSDVR